MDIHDVTKNLNKIVKFNDGRYDMDLILTACILRVRDGEFYYQAELLDKARNSIVIVPLDRVLIGEN